MRSKFQFDYQSVCHYSKTDRALKGSPPKV